MRRFRDERQFFLEGWLVCLLEICTFIESFAPALFQLLFFLCEFLLSGGKFLLRGIQLAFRICELCGALIDARPAFVQLGSGRIQLFFCLAQFLPALVQFGLVFIQNLITADRRSLLAQRLQTIDVSVPVSRAGRRTHP